MKFEAALLIAAAAAGGVLGSEYHWYAKPSSSGNGSGRDFANACGLGSLLNRIPSGNDSSDRIIRLPDIGCYEFRPDNSMVIFR